MDILIVGAGLGGCSAAAQAADMLRARPPFRDISVPRTGGLCRCGWLRVKPVPGAVQ